MTAATRDTAVNEPVARVLLVEDDDIMRVSLEDRLRLEGVPVRVASSLAEAQTILDRHAVDLVVTDIRLPDGSGRDLFDSLRRHRVGIPVILMTGYGTIADAVDLVQKGAADYLTKPFRMTVFIGLVRRLLDERQDVATLVTREGGRFHAGDGLLGPSPAMRRIERLVSRIAPLESSVLITGESGVGKEVVADLIHHNSPRRDHPFVKVNCAALPLTLVESELFGYEKGAFTGADGRRAGKFEQAQGGTIFLDEVAEIPPEVQVKLLRVVQERKLSRLGGREEIPLDVRIIAATQVDLEKAMAEGSFRADLFWRLNVISVPVPPLRERPEDVVCLARRFIEELAGSFGRPLMGLTPAAEALLAAGSYPGNVRELRNLIERAVALADGQRIDSEDLVAHRKPAYEADTVSGANQRLLRDAVETAERVSISAALEASGGGISTAANRLGISRKNLWEKMRRYGISRSKGPRNGVME